MSVKSESKAVVDKIGLSSFSEGYSERSEFLVATLIAVPPDGGYGWIILCASFFNNFLIGFYYAFPLVLSNISQNHAPLTFHELAYSMGLAGFSFNIAGIISCGLLNSCGYRVGNFVGTIILFLSYCTLAFSHNVIMIYIFHGLFSGIGFGIMNVSSMLAVNHYFEKYRLVTSIISGAGACFGIMISPFIFYLFAKKDEEHNHEEHGHLGIMKECELYLIIASAIIGIVGLTASALLKPLKPKLLMLPEEGKYFSLASVPHLSQDESTHKIGCCSKMKKLSIQELPTLANVKSAIPSKLEVIKDDTDKDPERQHSYVAHPFNRDDIFYSQTMMKNKVYTETQPTQQTESSGVTKGHQNVNYHMAVSRISLIKDLGKKGFNCTSTLTDGFWGVVYFLREFSLMKKPSYLCLLLSAIFTGAGMLTTFTFWFDHLITKDFDITKGVTCFGTIGLSNMVGRFVLGFLLTRKKCTGLCIYTFSLIMITIDLLLIDLYTTKTHYFFSAFIFGFFIASVHIVYTDIIVNFIGLEKLTSGFVYLLLFFGIGEILGVSICGLITAASGTNMKIQLPGIYFAISSIFCIIIYIIKRCKPK
ncbi:uncharacterized protein LOC123300302 [Chrysoperla carnea]|uniref:uncharacterized protein LOC123300302 n=1 Tax=Chrysoperla carnea TaxID=189513 RepID=UPI001D079B75|nr:uncharacterized protein LOC123300302 [Chrysoperla carnea]